MTAINSVTDLTLEGDIAVLTINSPPVNALSAEVRNGLRDGALQKFFHTLVQDPLVRSVHVDQYHAVSRLRQDVDAMQLRDGKPQRRVIGAWGVLGHPRRHALPRRGSPGKSTAPGNARSAPSWSMSPTRGRSCAA